jgi:hypothetical protein
MGTSLSASFQRAKEPSLRQSDPAQQIGKSRVGMQAVKERIVLEKNHATGALLDTAIQPIESLVLVF